MARAAKPVTSVGRPVDRTWTTKDDRERDTYVPGDKDRDENNKNKNDK